MRIEAKTYGTTPGRTEVTSGDLAYLFTGFLVEVKREGVLYDIIYSGTPTNRQVLYTRKEGKLTFGTPHPSGASVFVIYQH